MRVLGVSGPSTLPLYRGAGEGGLEFAIGPARPGDAILVVHGRGTLARDEPLALAGAPVLTRLGVVVIDPFDRLLWVRAAAPRGSAVAGAADTR